MYEKYDDAVNKSIALRKVIDELSVRDVYAVIQNRVPDFPDDMQLVAVFIDADEAVDYANLIFDAYQLKGRADAYRVDVVKYSYKYSANFSAQGWFSPDEVFYNIVKFGD